MSSDFGLFKSIAISSILQSLPFPPCFWFDKEFSFFSWFAAEHSMDFIRDWEHFQLTKRHQRSVQLWYPWPGPNAVTLGTKYMCFFKQCILFVFLRSYLPNKGQVNLAMGEPSTLGASEQGMFMSLHFIWDAPSTTRSGSNTWFIQWFKIPSPAVQQNLHKNYAWSLR